MPPDDALTGSWLAARWGTDPVAIEARRRGGELFARRDPGSDEWRYPAWQFDEEGRVRPEVERVLTAAREAGFRPGQLGEILDRRVGLARGRTMVDSLRGGDPAPVLAVIRAAH